MYVENRTKIANFPTPVYLTPPMKGSPWNFVSAQGSEETRVMGLSGGRKRFQICLVVLIQYRSVTDTRPATLP